MEVEIGPLRIIGDIRLFFRQAGQIFVRQPSGLHFLFVMISEFLIDVSLALLRGRKERGTAHQVFQLILVKIIQPDAPCLGYCRRLDTYLISFLLGKPQFKGRLVAVIRYLPAIFIRENIVEVLSGPTVPEP